MCKNAFRNKTVRMNNYPLKLLGISSFIARFVILLVVGLLIMVTTQKAHATVIVQHGATISKGCDSPKTPGDTTDCQIRVGYNDDAGDTISVDEAWDVEDVGGDNVRVPAVGNLPIVAVSGNTTCTVAGTLPCKIGPAGSVLNGLPGVGTNGSVTFASNTYVIQSNDPDPLPDQGNAKVHDLCDAPNANTNGCNGASNQIQFSSQTDLTFNPDVATVIHNPDHQVVTSVPVGTTVHDNATVSGTHGTPTGTVDFNRYSTDNCTGNFVAENNVPLVSGVAESSGFVTTGAALSYKVHYDGDGEYNPKDADCEPLTIEKLTPSVRTEIHNPNHTDITNTTVPVGTVIHDRAFVTGAGPAPAGTVDFRRYATNDCSGDSVDENDVSQVSGQWESSIFTTVAGSLSYLVHYDGDDNYKTGDGICEPLTIEKLTPTLRTQIHDPNHTDITNTTVNAGTVVHDKAFVAGSGANPGGTVDFKRFTNGTCTGNPANTQSGVALSNANPALAESNNFTTVAGAMSYLVHYSGDNNYKDGDGVCEPLTVQEVPQGCTLTQGYWKNHPDAWPVGSLLLGSVSYTKAQLLTILKTPVKGNGLISLSHQLIAAKLNIASGASSASIASTIVSADALIGSKVVPPVGSGFLSPSSTSSLTSALDNYNSGITGPGHCSE